MDILTLNTWGTRGPQARRKVLLAAIRSLHPDVVCLQEVTDPAWLKTLSFPTSVYAQGSGLATLSRFVSTSRKIVTYSALSPLEPYRRQVLLSELQAEESSLWVITTHLAWRAEDEATRLAQVGELLKIAAPLGDLVLVSGDFNAEPESRPMKRIKESGFIDLFATLNPHDPGITWDNVNPFIQSHEVKFPNRRIDYLLLKESALKWLTPIRCQVVCRTPTLKGLFPSDHYGVLAELDLPTLQEGAAG